MNKTPLLALAIFLLLATLTQAEQSALTVGARRHVDHSSLTDLPFDDGDIGYLVAYETANAGACLQFGAEYAPDVTGTNKATGSNSVDYVVTPQINLILKDGIWRGGTGILDSYIAGGDNGKKQWSGIYWQIFLGIAVPVGGFEVGANAFYTFDKLSRFEHKDIEYGAYLRYSF